MDDLNAKNPSTDVADIDTGQNSQDFVISRSVRNFVLAAIGLSLPIWDLSFHLGVYKTVFYDKFFVIWVICTVILLANFFMPARHRYLDFLGLIAMLSPTLFFVLQAWYYVFGATNWISWFEFGLTTFLFLFCLPYGAYIVIAFTQEEALKIRPRSLLWSLIAIATFIGSLGYMTGNYHRFFVTCEMFKVAGDDVPKNCLSESELGQHFH